MSSSQTMTAPAVKYRPGLNESVYSAPQSNDHLVSPRDNSAILRCGPERPTANGSIFSEAEEYLKKQEELEKQSAASSLLAQLLAPPPSPPRPRPPYSPVEPPKDLLEEKVVSPIQSTIGKPDKHTISHDEASLRLESPVPLDLGRDYLRPGNQETMKEEPFPRVLDAVTGVMVDPLSKTSQESLGLLPYDGAATRKSVMEAPQQNEPLTSSFLSHGADLYLSGLPDLSGYSQSQPYDSAGSIAGSEPRIQAFAKLEFDDGHFYVNTYSFILGRDVRAARAAYQRELQARQAMGRPPKNKSSSGGNTSQTPNRVKREGSAIIGSVVSDRGGIMGFDPDVPPHLPPQLSKKSSNSSHGDSGQALHATPAQLHTDYNALAMQSLYEGNGDAKPVDTLALLPSPDACPTIPIHPPATADGSTAGHKGISRKHVKIAYNFDKNLFEMEVIGRNGAFIGADWLAPGQIRPLHSGDYIQIGGVRIRFLLPDVPIGETGADRVEDSYVEEDENSMAITTIVEHEKITADLDPGDHREGERADGKGKSKVTKIVLKTTESRSSEPRPSIEGNPETPQQPPRRRGPGRPPKDGIMSKRERAEIAREQKLAAKREANGGVTPPPSNRSKTGKPRSEDPITDPTTMKPEKRKYTKRKKLDGIPLDPSIQSVEGGELLPLEQLVEDYPKAPVKKRKPSRSPSPDYPPESAYTPEDLAKPPYNYAVLIFDALTESPTPMTLKQIYRALKMKYPYFRFKCETEGWTSSVRHNLNGNGHLFMHAERDGKGWSWQLRPGASVEKEKKRRPSPPPPSPRPSSPAQPLARTSNAEPCVPTRAPAHINQTGVADRPPNHQFQFPYIAPSPYNGTGPAPQHSSPYPPPSPALPLPSPIRNSLPPAFAKAMPTEYTSPYASDPPPVLAQFQEQQARQAEAILTRKQPPSYPSKNLPMPNLSARPPNSPVYIAPSHPQPPQKPNIVSNPVMPDPIPNEPETASFTERAHKAIDDFEAVFMEDYDDKDYIREVLKSARARVLGGARDSSFTDGEPKDEAVIVDALRNLIESLEKE